MKGFKDTTKTCYSKGGPVGGTKGAAKVGVVMKEFKQGKLHSGSDKGPKVTSPKQAVAIALSEAGKSKAQPVKKSLGGLITKGLTGGVLGALAGGGAGGVAPALGGVAGLALADMLRKKKQGVVAPTAPTAPMTSQPTQAYAKGGGVKRHSGLGFGSKPLIGK